MATQTVGSVAQVATSPIKRPVILIVEDEIFLANLLLLRFQKENFEVVQAFSGTEALKKLEEISPDLVLLDLILPNKNGFEVLEEVSQNPQWRTIPVIIVSNLGQESDIERGKQFGAMDYYVKARLSIDELVKKVKDITGSSTA
ncbi:MAG: Phosphate regulon transcriptional regulatory protein PhoB [Parcubacteria group bacterium GW2011_GWB1_46_8]|nr:MAG: Phosphate regulon transcriptional regulatory protein PhoB [Parcubacteria group bacterium GW2011_GWA1_45_7]KKU43686.1 MAG: Phosphate regulon transcriptional regulatory protein PhoB [Parcubacteria group bacterium GW2011_GWA2_46_7]KKU46501.1 MAG: Phosphate regulon transcriptional regulatory protein PhoB [Parcubacteria group bacterium GW2011_GWB1_46_8]